MTKSVEIRDRVVGENLPVLVIAEIGSNHDQRLDQAKRLMEAAVRSGADAIKFQLYAADDLYSPSSYVYELVKATELPREWLPDLIKTATDLGTLFLCSPFEQWAVDELDRLSVPAYKWASSETTNLKLLKYAASKMRPILLATGMCDLADVYEAVQVIHSEMNDQIVLLQCTSLYPTLPHQVHLAVMDTLRSAFQLPVGLSDHTLDISVPIAAVARGACVIEKHLTLDRHLQGPDHSYALEPDQFKRMVEGIREVEQAIGSPSKMMLPEEAQVARREGVRAQREINSGEKITPEMLMYERPALGLRPRFASAILGMTARVKIPQGEAISWNMLSN